MSLSQKLFFKMGGSEYFRKPVAKCVVYWIDKGSNKFYRAMVFQKTSGEFSGFCDYGRIETMEKKGDNLLSTCSEYCSSSSLDEVKEITLRKIKEKVRKGYTLHTNGIPRSSNVKDVKMKLLL